MQGLRLWGWGLGVQRGGAYVGGWPCIQQWHPSPPASPPAAAPAASVCVCLCVFEPTHTTTHAQVISWRVRVCEREGVVPLSESVCAIWMQRKARMTSKAMEEQNSCISQQCFLPVKRVGP